MNFIDSDSEKTDTEYLWKFIEQRGADTFEKMVTVFAELEKKKISLWVICIYDTVNQTAFVISDGARSMYLCFHPQNENKMQYFSSISDGGSDEFSFYGWFVVNMEGDVLAKEFKYFNKYDEKKKTSTYSHGQDYSSYHKHTPNYAPTSNAYSRGGWGQNKVSDEKASNSWIPFAKKGTETWVGKTPKGTQMTIEYNETIVFSIEDNFISYLEKYEDEVVSKYWEVVEALMLGYSSWKAHEKRIADLTKAIEAWNANAKYYKTQWRLGFLDAFCQKWIEDEMQIESYINTKNEEFQEMVLNTL